MDREGLGEYDNSLIHKTWKQDYAEYIEKKAHESGMAYPGEKIYLPRQS